jgi:DNA-directed RNA polymerase specialized sigma24 family protein
MESGQAANPEPKGRLDQISTEWSMIRDSGRFVQRYTPAINKYLCALIKNQHDAEDVLQDFLLRVVETGFLRLQRQGGRFRDYLKTAVRNAALNHLQRNGASKRAPHFHRSADLATLSARADGGWLIHWRQVLLDRAWNALKRHQMRNRGNLAYTVLRVAVEYPDESSHEHASRTRAISGHPLGAAAFRKQLSRARRLFARALVHEVVQTLDHATPDQVEDELCELGLMEYVQNYLPPKWRGWVISR